MKLQLELKIENIFKSKDFTDKKTGEVTPGKWKIQTFENIETEEGIQMKLFDISITDEYAEKVKNKKGETVTFPVRAYFANGKIGYYGI